MKGAGLREAPSTAPIIIPAMAPSAMWLRSRCSSSSSLSGSSSLPGGPRRRARACVHRFLLRTAAPSELYSHHWKAHQLGAKRAKLRSVCFCYALGLLSKCLLSLLPELVLAHLGADGSMREGENINISCNFFLFLHVRNI